MQNLVTNIYFSVNYNNLFLFCYFYYFWHLSHGRNYVRYLKMSVINLDLYRFQYVSLHFVFPCRTTVHIWALPFSVLRFLNCTQLDTRQDSSGRVISPSQRPVPTQDNTTYKHRRQTSMARVGFETAIPTTKQAEDLRLIVRQRGHREWHCIPFL
jgi:hypothetical protein